ncbi:hypothetical protein [Flavobacterium sp. XS2P14]|uniref:hypothetical protein n=1 Tax=Flavobacterium sp. XS2P14 TaxID=3401735 RepID=UPI003AAF3400
MKQKIYTYIKYTSYVIALLGFIDLLVNPKIQHLNSNYEVIHDYGRIFLMSVIVICMCAIIISTYFLDANKKKWKNIFVISSSIYLILMLYIINKFFYIFWFNQMVDFVIFSLHILPVVFILNDLLKPKWSKMKFFPPIGILLIILTSFYFKNIYVSYEDYWNGTPIVVIHYLFRDWICLIGTVMILVPLLSIDINEK